MRLRASTDPSHSIQVSGEQKVGWGDTCLGRSRRRTRLADARRLRFLLQEAELSVFKGGVPAIEGSSSRTPPTRRSGVFVRTGPRARGGIDLHINTRSGPLHWRGTLRQLPPSLALPILSRASLSPAAARPTSSD